ncbi:MAG: hypothetical protein PWQ96_913 [Clostridia bacterium]|jgi:hypothetical protein|nr:hypothetical protein [Clostridiales bacterium]MDK2985271.1 hypothetical protein [Clostridia bacterium]
MKLYGTLIFLVVLIVAFGIFTSNFLTETTKDITSNFDNVYTAINNENWKLAQQQIAHSEKLWNKHKKWWTVFIDHQEIDNIDMSFVRIGEYIKYHNKALSSGELVVLKQSFEHIPEKEVVNLKNIL